MERERGQTQLALSTRDYKIDHSSLSRSCQAKITAKKQKDEREK